MEGLKFRFVTGSGTLTKTGTDFRVEYGASGDPATFQVTLARIWEVTDPSKHAYDARKAVEDRVQTLLWSYRLRRGTLDVARDGDATWAGAGSASFANVKLVDVKFNESSANRWIDYDLVFDYSVGGEIARTLQFGAKTVSARAFIVGYGVEDRTVFKKPFRFAPVRIVGGPGLQTISVTAVKELITGSSDLARRQAIEAELKAWVDRKGTSQALLIDSTNKGLCHLQEVTAGEMNLLDAMTYDLSFATGYVEG
ncbi:MAG TPA: hypothetical protein VGP72_14735 [Planctomycetota bacterium]|jgi:acid stress-induced BolA-like protein IbaG/YrbA